MKRILAFLSAVAVSVPLSAQSDCATVTPPGYETQLAQRLSAPAPQNQGLIVVPVHIHLIRDGNGNSSITLQDVQTELDSANYYYQNAGLIFVECIAAEMIDDDSLFDYERVTEENILLSNHFTPNVLNLYFANTVSSNFTTVCGYSYFPPGIDVAFISASCINGSTLAHEIGHYMGLMHTHGGSSDELVDGTNCSSEGDLICDTPADPGLSGLVDTSCMYTGTQLDANNMPYQPDVTNIMSYSRKVCRVNFTPTQYQVIMNTYWGDRTYLQCIPTGMNEPAVSSRVFPNPADGEVRILFANGAEEGTVITFYNSLGQVVHVQNTNPDDTFVTIQTGEFAEGNYSCVITMPDGTITTHEIVIIR